MASATKAQTTKRISEELKPAAVEVLYCLQGSNSRDEWHALLEKCSFWKTLRVTGWVLRLKNNSLAKKREMKKTNGPLTTEEILSA